MEENTKKNYTKIILIVAIALLLIVACLLLVLKDKIFNKKPNKGGTETIITYPLKSELKMADNSINDFDLYFLQLENKPQNKIYSPISIKYALAMLNEGASGETKKQIDTIIGDYTARSYTNSANMSFANALFVKDSFQSKIKESYITTLQNQYDAEVKYDSFSSPDNINNWVSEKTFDLIKKPLEDVTGLKYAIINALAIDMEWQNEIQSEWQDYSLDYKHERAVEGDKTINHVNICSLNECGYSSLPLNNKVAKAVHFAAYANKYDIMNELGEDQIRETLNTEYEKWYEENKDRGFNLKEFDIDEYISELSSNYNKYSSSTDFLFYDDSNIKAFAKDLKTYDGVTLEYIGIMPKQTELTEYVKNINANKVKEVINNLKPIDLETFEEGYLTIIEGYLPLFDYDYDLNFKEDLQKIGIIDVFDMSKADLSNLSTVDTYIDKAIHKAKIEFSNKGIKAAAVTIFGGVESTIALKDLEFTYAFDVPAKYIDLTFNKPYMYIIRDKESGEVWFTGTVYEGSAFSWNN